MFCCYSFASCWLLYKFLLMMSAGSLVSILSASVLFLILLASCFWRGPRPAEFRTPLLWSVCLAVLGVVCAFQLPEFAPMCAPLSLVGVIDIVWWIGNKRYKGLTFKDFVNREFHIPPTLEFAFLFVNIINAVENDVLDSPWIWIVEIFLLVDLIIQKRKGILCHFRK